MRGKKERRVLIASILLFQKRDRQVLTLVQVVSTVTTTV